MPKFLNITTRSRFETTQECPCQATTLRYKCNLLTFLLSPHANLDGQHRVKPHRSPLPYRNYASGITDDREAPRTIQIRSERVRRRATPGGDGGAPAAEICARLRKENSRPISACSPPVKSRCFFSRKESADTGPARKA